MAENLAAFILRRFRSLGFSKCRWLRTSFNVPSRSIFFFNRRRALSTDSPFFSLISVKLAHFLSNNLGVAGAKCGLPLRSSRGGYFCLRKSQIRNATIRNATMEIRDYFARRPAARTELRIQLASP